MTLPSLKTHAFQCCVILIGLTRLSDEQIGKLIKYILIYGKSLYDGIEIAPPSDPNINFVFQFLKGQIDRDYLKWAKKCEQNSENARKRTQSIDTNPNNS